MAPRLTVISWRDLPAQVVAKDGRRSAKHVLALRFQVAIDRAATRAGRKEMDDYLEEWRRTDRPCGPDLDAEVAAEVARIEARFTRTHLATVVAALGIEADVPASGPDTTPAAAHGARTGPAAGDAAPEAVEDQWPAP